MKKILTVLLLGVAPYLFAADEAAAPPPSLVETAVIAEGMVNPLQTFVGTLYYDRKSALSAESAGRIETIRVDEGQKVARGTGLVTLDSAILRATIAARKAGIKAQEAELEKQRRDLERSSALLSRKSISQSSYDTIYYQVEMMKAQIDAAKSELEAMQIELEKTEVSAPFDGVISRRDVNLGEWVSKGDPVVELVDPDSIEARVNLPASLIGTIKTGKKLEATIGEQPVDATIKSIIPVADKTTRTFPVKLTLKSDAVLIEGMRIDVSVPMLNKSSALLVPRDCVIRRFGQVVIFTVNNGTAAMIPVKVVGYDGNRAAIAGAGLQPGMPVVVKGNERIFPNMPVMVKGAQ